MDSVDSAGPHLELPNEHLVAFSKGLQPLDLVHQLLHLGRPLSVARGQQATRNRGFLYSGGHSQGSRGRGETWMWMWKRNPAMQKGADLTHHHRESTRRRRDTSVARGGQIQSQALTGGSMSAGHQGDVPGAQEGVGWETGDGGALDCHLADRLGSCSPSSQTKGHVTKWHITEGCACSLVV